MLTPQSFSGASPVSRRSALLASLAVAALAIAVAPAASLAASEPNVLTPQQAAEGWISLFDGDTLFGWQSTANTNWKVDVGAIRVAGGERGFLMTASRFADFELHVEFDAPPTTNSGVFLRTPLNPTDPARDCLELNIAPPDNPFPTGSLVSRKKWDDARIAANRSTAPPLYGAKSKDAQGTVGVQNRDAEWNSFDVRAVGAKVTVWLNGHQLYTLDSPKGAVPPGESRFSGTGAPRKIEPPAAVSPPLPAGHIGLQVREGPVAFRNIRLKPLGFDRLLRDGWNTDRLDQANLRTTPEGVLHLTGGPGQLETAGEYGDFVLQYDAFVDGDGLNSGVFFRSIPRDFAMGYECQINNAVLDGDPAKPKDAGTGAIYRRTTARRVVPRDREWFTTTLIADGPHFAVWENGQQVTDWTDDRPPHENPRKGLRIAPGTISLQAHDPTTNLRFRNLRIVELPKAAD
jgi:hypothetical protein